MIRQILSFPIKCYQHIVSPCCQSRCRFYPSCSQYALDALAQFGAFKGVYVTCIRLLRCHPWSEGGYDPVLPNKEKL